MRYHIMFSSKGDNRSVYIASSYRNENGQSRKNIVRRCGNLKKLLAADPKALEKIEAEVRSLNEKAAGEDIKKRLLDNETIEADIIRAAKDGIMLKGEKPCLRGLGMIVLDRLWNELNLPYKLSYLKKECDVQFDFEEVVKQLCLGRILAPWSKAKTCRLAPVSYLGAKEENLAHYYNCLDLLSKNKDSVIKYLNKKLLEGNPHRDTRVCLYDITTYAFESVEADSLREFGYSKDKKNNEVQVVMALAADKDGLPISYNLYRGNQGESPTMVPFIEELKKTYGVENLIVVADKGLNNTANIHCLPELSNNYVLSSKIRSASREIKEAALDPTGRVERLVADGNGVLSKTWFKEVTLETKVSYKYPDFAYEKSNPEEKKKLENKLKPYTTKYGNKKGTIKRRFIITFLEKRLIKDRIDRQRLIKKAERLVANPSNFSAELKKGGKSLVSVDIDKESLTVNYERISEQELFDGMHAIETSLEEPAEEVLDIYKGLWHIESNFRVLKSQLEGRPVYVRTEDHIRGHFLCCYISLVISRLLEYKLRKRKTSIPISKIVEALNCLRTTKIKLDRLPAIYATTGISEEIKQICAALGMQVPEDYETAASLRKKLALKGELGSYFRVREAITTAKEKTKS
ncbi:IS1634 family transposase [Parasutterella excrementihominis]|jgi:transposase|uniref:IS1634 family transposase n=1 Tax=Parasutterella excrementihominis TaxID=487175 RepID=UPI0024300528|nr:IS1634 family transposase [Parasutterella excrementihominis]MCI9301320.1 IS1634 family transposase [Parasutterella excrementihominis]